MALPKSYSIIIVPSDHSGTRQFRISRTLWITSIALASILLLLMVVFAATYTTVLQEARRASGLQDENRELREQVARVNDLSQELESVSALRAQVLNMLGISEADMPTLAPDTTETGARGEETLLDPDRLQQIFAEESRKPYAPRKWPSDGAIRREFIDEEDAGRPPHPGLALDPTSTGVIVAAGRGRIVEVLDDWPGPTASGQAVVIDHGYGFRTSYVGFVRLEVSLGQYVERGQPLGVVSGDDSTGGANRGSRNASGALYFELRVDGTPVDPRAYLQER